MSNSPTVLTIAGSDPYGGAGIQADLKAIHACGGYALSAITAITAQNSQGVFGVYPIAKEAFALQLETLLKDIHIDAIKIGMLANADLITLTAELLETYPCPSIVLDTPFVSSSGARLLDEEALACFKQRLLPLASVLTPNLTEVSALLNHPINEQTLSSAAAALIQQGAQAVIIKGGHSRDPTQACDHLYQKQPDLVSESVFCTPRIATPHTHGTGCSFASALATFLAQGATLIQATEQAKQQMHLWLSQSDALQLRYQTSHDTRKEPLDHLPLYRTS